MGETRKTGPQLGDIEIGAADAESLAGLAGLLRRIQEACDAEAALQGRSTRAGGYLSSMARDCGAAVAWANLAAGELSR